jgi:hypothetical protein
LLMEGVRQLDEFTHLRRQLPALGSPLAVPTPLAGKLRELTPSELDTFQLVLDHGSTTSGHRPRRSAEHYESDEARVVVVP